MRVSSPADRTGDGGGSGWMLGVVDALEFSHRQARGELPALAAHCAVAEAAGERALGAQDFAVQVVALDVETEGVENRICSEALSKSTAHPMQCSK